MSRTYKVTFLPQNIVCEAKEGTTILEAQTQAGLEPDAPCGGGGKCGKCKVEILEGSETGIVLACQFRITCDMKVNTHPAEKLDRILTEGFERSVQVAPGVGAEGQSFYVVAFDIGTTTIVGYLLSGTTGEEVAVASMMNPQHQYGADVISRANYVLEHQEGSEKLKNTVRKALNQLIGQLVEKAGVKRQEILQISIVGNTCMHHLFMGISPQSLVLAPYVPAVQEGMTLRAADCDLTIAEEGRILLFPNIAGFVGGDTVGCMLSVAFDQLEEMTLMIDIGTNGELVMGNKTRMVTTSTAAGPAFEGAKIECGMRGARGAISHLAVEAGELKFEVVDNEKPVGICGSGLIDILAFLIRHGFVDNYGGLAEEDDLEDPLAVSQAWRLQEKDGKPVFVLVPAEESGTGEMIYISQKDIREVQLAKGAIAAGITIMADKLGIPVEEIRHVYLAGAFGNYMDSDNACEIGLIPYSLKERIMPIGNAAGEGAKLAVINHDEYTYACSLAGEAEFIELASEMSFQDIFVDELEFARAVER
ncbi:MAG: ASKHA domain-containing protein [Lachnospiraceae bacterium]|nr:ASKHA domain-containing protein [Lachnospiraceae bacterium]